MLPLSRLPLRARLLCIWHSSPEMQELFLGCLSLAWGLWFLSHGNRTFLTANVWSAMGRVMSQRSWGIWFTLMGTGQVAALLGGWTRIRCGLCLFAEVTWLFCAFYLYLSNKNGLDIPTLFLYALFSSIVCVRLWGQDP